MTDLCEWKGKCRKIPGILTNLGNVAITGPRHWDDDVSSESLASSNNENTSESRGAENWPSVRWGSLASLASRWTSTNITSEDYNLIPGPSPWHSICILRLFLPCFTIFATKCNRIHLSAKDNWDFKTKRKSFLCLICILFRKKQVLMVSSQCLPKKEMIIC